jgi:hypothetical protein
LVDERSGQPPPAWGPPNQPTGWDQQSPGWDQQSPGCGQPTDWPAAPQSGWHPAAPDYSSYGPPVRTTLDGFSVAGLIFGILPIVPLGLIFGVTGIVRTSRQARRGRTLAVVGLLLSALWLMVIAAGLAGRHDSSQPEAEQRSSAAVAVPSSSPAATDAVSPRDLRPGDCFMLGRSGPVASIRLLPCSQPHDAQAFANLQLPYRPYPGAAKTFAAALKVCEPAARSYLNGHTDLLRVATFYPNDVSWAIGDYTAHCILYDPRQNFVGDARHHY